VPIFSGSLKATLNQPVPLFNPYLTKKTLDKPISGVMVEMV